MPTIQYVVIFIIFKYGYVFQTIFFKE